MKNELEQIQNAAIDPAQVKGWGIDADPKNDPTYPIKKRNDGEHAGYTWQRPAQQANSVEVLYSNERPDLTAAFGTSTPPAGLSGMIRRAAFRYSENSYAHWLPLMFADRVGIVEGVISDLSRGHLPNVFAERGWNAEWKHNRKSLLMRIAIGAAVSLAAVAYLRRKKKLNSHAKCAITGHR